MSIDKFGREARSSHGSQTSFGRKFMTLNAGGDLDVGGKRLRNVGFPLTLHDAVNVSHLVGNTPLKLNNSYSFHMFKMEDVGYPESDGDAANVAYVKRNALVRDKNNIFDVCNTSVSNLAPPTKSGDAVNLAYFKSNTPRYSYSGKEWNFLGKRLTQVAPPTQADDVVTLEHFNSYALTKDFQNKIDAGLYRINNLGHPTHPLDAVNVVFLKEQLGKLALVIYEKLNKNGNVPDEAEWNAGVMNTTDWKDIFIGI